MSIYNLLNFSSHCLYYFSVNFWRTWYLLIPISYGPVLLGLWEQVTIYAYHINDSSIQYPKILMFLNNKSEYPCNNKLVIITHQLKVNVLICRALRILNWSSSC